MGMIAKCLFVTVGLTHGFSLDLKPLLVASLFVSTNSLSLNLGAPRKVGRPRHFLSQENIDNIVSLYNSGEPTSIIAEQFKVGAQRVRNILKEHNIELSPGRRRPFGPRRLGKTDWEAKAAELLIKQVERGEPMMSVGRQVNASWSTIATLLDRNASLAASLDNARAKVEEERIAEADRIGKELTAAVEEAEATARREADAALNVLTARREAKEAQLRALLAEPSPSATTRTDIEMVKLRHKGLTLREIGEQHDCTRERVRQRLGKYGITGFASFTREELAALACVYVATPVDIRGDDGSPAMQAVLDAAEAHGLNTTWLDGRRWEKDARLKGAKVKRTQRLKLARDAEIAKSIARGDELDDIALRVGYHAHGTGRYPSIAIRKRMEAMGLHQKRKRLKVKRDLNRKGIHPYDKEIDAGIAAGEACEHLAARLDLSIMYVSKRARRGTVKIDGARDERLRELRLEGRQCKDIARTMGESMNWVSSRVTLLGLPAFE